MKEPRTITIFKKDFDGKAKYSRAIKYKKDGEDKFAYQTVYFKKDVVLADKTKIKIKESWTGAYETADGKWVFTEFINDFSKEDSGDIPSGFQIVDDDDIPFD